MYLYAFGSLVRGEVDKFSDVDLLVIDPADVDQFDSNKFSIYSSDRMKQLWNDGNPFAWHLHCESRLLFSSTPVDFLSKLGKPNRYLFRLRDCSQFKKILTDAKISLDTNEKYARIFDLSTAFLAMRNFATCFSFDALKQPNFSRRSALELNENSISLNKETHLILERARLLSTRGVGEMLTEAEIKSGIESLAVVEKWMIKLQKHLEEK